MNLQVGVASKKENKGLYLTSPLVELQPFRFPYLLGILKFTPFFPLGDWRSKTVGIVKFTPFFPLVIGEVRHTPQVLWMFFGPVLLEDGRRRGGSSGLAV